MSVLQVSSESHVLVHAAAAVLLYWLAHVGYSAHLRRSHVRR